MEAIVGDAEVGEPLDKLLGRLAGDRHTAHIALHIGEEARHPDIGEVLRERLERDGLARARGTGDETVTVGHLREQVDWLITLCDQQLAIHVHEAPSFLSTCARRHGADGGRTHVSHMQMLQQAYHAVPCEGRGGKAGRIGSPAIHPQRGRRFPPDEPLLEAGAIARSAPPAPAPTGRRFLPSTPRHEPYRNPSTCKLLSWTRSARSSSRSCSIAARVRPSCACHASS